MRTFSWNCRGAGSHLAIQRLQEIRRRFFPEFIFLCETKNSRPLLEDFKLSFGYDQLFTVEPLGRSGGLALFYLYSFNVSILLSSDRMIDIEATFEGNKIFMNFFYGDPVFKFRSQVWDCLADIALSRDGAWFMIGDFNEPTSNSEKHGRRRRPESSFLPFKLMLKNFSMHEFHYRGNALSRVGPCGKNLIKCRLDRAIRNEDWHEAFSHTHAVHATLGLWSSTPHGYY